MFLDYHLRISFEGSNQKILVCLMDKKGTWYDKKSNELQEIIKSFLRDEDNWPWYKSFDTSGDLANQLNQISDYAFQLIKKINEFHEKSILIKN